MGRLRNGLKEGGEIRAWASKCKLSKESETKKIDLVRGCSGFSFELLFDYRLRNEAYAVWKSIRPI